MAAVNAGGGGASDAHFSDGDRQGANPLGWNLCRYLGGAAVAGRPVAVMDKSVKKWSVSPSLGLLRSRSEYHSCG